MTRREELLLCRDKYKREHRELANRIQQLGELMGAVDKDLREDDWATLKTLKEAVET